METGQQNRLDATADTLTITWNNKEQLRTLNTTKALKMRALAIVYPNCSKLLIINYLPTQEL